MSNHINRTEKTKDFTIITNAVLQKSDLSPGALGVLVYLLSLPPNWNIIKSHLQSVFVNCGRHKLNRIFDELMDAGYLVDVTDDNRDESGQFSRNVYHVYERPSDAPKNKQPRQSAAGQPKQPGELREPIYGGGFSRDGGNGRGSSATADRQLQSTYTTKDVPYKEIKKTNKQPHKPAHARTAAAGPAQQVSAFGGGVDDSLSETGEHVVDAQPENREGVEFSEKETKQDTAPAEALLTQWGGINLHRAVTEAPPQRIVRAMLYVAECLSEPNHGIVRPNGVLVDTITGDKRIPSPRSAAPPAQKYQWLWDEATRLGIIDPQPDDQPPQDKPLPTWMQRDAQLNATILPVAAEALAECKSMLEMEYDLATYNTYLKDIQCTDYDPATHTYTLTTSRTTSHDMLEQRLHRNIQNTLSTAAGQPVTVTWQRWQDAIADKQPVAAV